MPPNWLRDYAALLATRSSFAIDAFIRWCAWRIHKITRQSVSGRMVQKLDRAENTGHRPTRPESREDDVGR
jgi:hypothetical protein